MNKQWEWNNDTKTYDLATTGYTTGFGKGCHTGNTAIYTEKSAKKTYGTLFIGGWSNDAIVTHNTHVIDLTGTEQRFYQIPEAMDENSVDFLEFTHPCKGWLSLPFPDYGTPSNIKTKEQWQGITNVIRKILKQGTDVLVACTGGHGRSGMFCAIVGYLLNNGKNGWESPVTQIRKIHCDNAVETLAQEQFVYNILGIEVPVTKSYTAKTVGIVYEKCPICDTPSSFVKDFGMCWTCKSKFAPIAPVKHDLTVDDIDHPIEHTCVEGENCIGIYKADVCGHVVHNMIISDGLCEVCSWTNKQTTKPEEPEEQDTGSYGECANCHKQTYFGKFYGICYDCSTEIQKAGTADYVHNSNTDGYKAVPHTCAAGVQCTGIAIPDICKHTIHNMEIVDGLCPLCYNGRGDE